MSKTSFGSDGFRSTSDLSCHIEIIIPTSAVGFVIGKGGTTIKPLQKLPGVVNLQVLCAGNYQHKVIIRGKTKEAIQDAAFQVEELVVASISRSRPDAPWDFFVLCLREKFGAVRARGQVDSIEFKRIPRSKADVMFEKPNEHPFFVVKAFQEKPGREESSNSSKKCITADRGPSSYKGQLMGCISELLRRKVTSTSLNIGLQIVFGKQALYGNIAGSDVLSSAFATLSVDERTKFSIEKLEAYETLMDLRKRAARKTLRC